MLDNVVEVNGLPLEQQRDEIMRKRRHGMGFLGLGSTVTMLQMKYGSPESLRVHRSVSPRHGHRRLGSGPGAGARKKARRRSWTKSFTVTAEMLRKRPEMKNGRLEARPDRSRAACCTPSTRATCSAWPRWRRNWSSELAEVGARFTHHSSIAPTGTISLSLANNATNGIEPSFAHHYSRNVIREGKKSKEKVDVFSFELLAYRDLVNAEGDAVRGRTTQGRLPDYFISADDISPKEHVDIQAAAQKWIDSLDFQDRERADGLSVRGLQGHLPYAHEQGLKGCTTFRFNPAAFQGVLVKEADLENTTVPLRARRRQVVEVKGNEEIEYDGEMHTAANLFDALKEGYYGKF